MNEPELKAIFERCQRETTPEGVEKRQKALISSYNDKKAKRERHAKKKVIAQNQRELISRVNSRQNFDRSRVVA